MPVDDGVDKLNRKYTLLVFLFLALPIFTKQYIGDPIECFAPVYFAEHQSRYINSYCWTQSTYYMVPVGDPEDDGDQVSFCSANALNFSPRVGEWAPKWPAWPLWLFGSGVLLRAPLGIIRAPANRATERPNRAEFGPK